MTARAPDDLRVLMTADTVGGVFQYAVELATALAERGVTTVLATMGPRPSRAQRAAADAVPGLDLHESAYRLEWMPDAWADVDRAGAWLLELEAKTSPDIVHLNGYAHAVLGWRAPTVVVAHSCVLSWFASVRGPTGERTESGYREYRQRVTDGLASASAVVAPSRAMARALNQHYGRAIAARVINNGRSKHAYGSRAKEPFVLSIGRLWDDAKNVAALAAVAATLPWPVRVAGSASIEGHHPFDASGLEVMGELDPWEVRDALGRAAIYAHPALYEPFGLSVLEAALSSCALVLGDIASLRELWDGAAVFVHPGDSEGLGRALGDLMGDPERRAVLGVRARERAIDYGTDRMADAYLDVYRELCSPAMRTDLEGARCA